jgi:hypothetical protein
VVLSPDAITLRGTRVPGDFRRAEYFTYFRRLWHHALLLVFFLLVFTLGGVAHSQGNQKNLAGLIPFAVLFLLWVSCLVAIPLLGAKSKTAGKKWLGEATTFVFDAEGIRIASASLSSEIRWGLIKEVCETKSLFLLRSGEGLPVTIPKRLFADAAEIEAWKVMVQTQMKCRPIAIHGLAARWC